EQLHGTWRPKQRRGNADRKVGVPPGACGFCVFVWRTHMPYSHRAAGILRRPIPSARIGVPPGGYRPAGAEGSALAAAACGTDDLPPCAAASAAESRRLIARCAKAMVGALVFALTMFGITDASMTRKPCTPTTRRQGST